MTTPHPAAFDADRQIGVQPQPDIAALRIGDMTRLVDDRPRGRHPPVVEHRLAHHLDLDATLEALGHPDQHVLGVVVGGRSRMRRDGVRPR